MILCWPSDHLAHFDDVAYWVHLCDDGVVRISDGVDSEKLVYHQEIAYTIRAALRCDVIKPVWVEEKRSALSSAVLLRSALSSAEVLLRAALSSAVGRAAVGNRQCACFGESPTAGQWSCTARAG